jgi:hypothetical protein
MQAIPGLQSMEVAQAEAHAADVPLQKAGPHSPSGSELAGMALQDPGDAASAHETHVPVQALSQQTPSAQMPLAQWPATPSHLAPSAYLARQVPSPQNCPIPQSTSAVQVPPEFGTQEDWPPQVSPGQSSSGSVPAA